MTLLKKIFILVNLILCIFCINVLGVSADFTSESIKTLTKEFIESSTYQYVYGYNFLGNDSNPNSSSRLVFMNAPAYYCTNYYTDKGFINIGNSLEYTNPNFPYTSYKWAIYEFNSTTNSWKLSSSSGNTGTPVGYTWNDNYELWYCNYDMYYCTYDSSTSKFTISDNLWHTKDYDFYSIISSPGIDESSIDWESAFQYYVGTYEKDTGEGLGYEYASHNYIDKVFLYYKTNDLDGQLDVSFTMDNYNCFYNLILDFDFVFTDSSGNQHIETIFTNTSFDNNWNNLCFPYLIDDEKLKKTENYDSLAMAFEFYLGPFTGNYENWDAWLNECVECYIDSQGYFDYDLIVRPYVKKMYLNDLTFSEIVYTYKSFSLIYDIGNSNFINSSDSYTIFYPIEGNLDIYYFVNPDGLIIDGVDNSERYDFGDNWKIIDTWGYEPDITPVINKDTGNLEMRDPNDNVTNILPIGDNRPKPEEIIENIGTIGGFSLNDILEDLTENLNDLFVNNDSLSKMLEWFRYIFNWLPFDLLKIFATLIFLALIFIFFKLIS